MSAQYDPWIDGRAAPKVLAESAQSVAVEPPVQNPDLMKKLPALLRLLGAGALLIAMYSFLVKGWQSGNDVFRYLMMLGHTGALAAIGMASGHYLKESKGARLLLSLALVSVPANFAILGAFIFSQAGGVDVAAYPRYVAWAVDSLNTALLTTGGALLVLVPVTLLGFTVLARSMSKKLSLLFLVSNAALLLPLRDPQLIGLVVLGLTAFVMLWSRKTAAGNVAAKTQEGVIALGLQLLPLGVLMGRSLWLYSQDLFLMTVLAMTVFFTLRQMSLFFEAEGNVRHWLNALSLIPAVAVALLLSNAVVAMDVLPLSLVFPVGVMASAAMVYDISRRSSSAAGFYRRMAMVVMVAGMLGNLAVFADLLAALACVVSGLFLLMQGYKRQQRSLFAAGVINLAGGVLQQFYELVHHFDLGSWASLAVLGIVSIVVASTIESQAGNIKARVSAWKAGYDGWEK
jgi:hypothetical protein